MEVETEEERLKAENFVLKQEHTTLKRKYKDVLDKNKRWGNKDEKSEKSKAEQKAEIARLESRNQKTLQELTDTALVVSRLKARNAELEALCNEQSEETHAGERRFDDYLQAVTHLTAHFRRRPPDPARCESPVSPFKSEKAQRDSETQCPADKKSLLPMPRTERDISSTLFHPLQGKKTQPSAVRPSLTAKPEHRMQRDKGISSSANVTALFPTPRAGLGAMPSVSGGLRGEQHHSNKGEQEHSRQHLTSVEECSRKRALLPDEELAHLVEKRRKEEHSRHATDSRRKVSDPRLQLRRG